MSAKIYFISGGPCTGKTAVINQLQKQGYEIIPEVARQIAAEKFAGKSVKEIDRKLFQDEIFKMQKKLFEGPNSKDGCVFSDRGFGDTLAYYLLNGLITPQNFFEYAEKFNCAKVFILEPLNFYKKDALRQESPEERKRIHKEIIKTYSDLGYDMISVPFMSVEKRAEFVLKNSILRTNNF